MAQADIDRLDAVTASRCNKHFEDRYDEMTLQVARTGRAGALELSQSTVSLIPRVQARQNLLHGTLTVDLPNIQHVNFDGCEYAHC